MNFRKNYQKSCAVAEPACPLELQDYIFDKNKGTLVPTKKIEFYKEIQSHYESTRIDFKLRKYAMGDYTALGLPGGQYGDFSNLPTNLAQVLSAKESAESSFSKLPADLRELFGNDFTKFITSVEDGSYQQRLIEYARIKSGGTPGAGNDGGTPGASAGNSDNGGNN